MLVGADVLRCPGRACARRGGRSRCARPLVLRADVVPEVDRHQRHQGRWSPRPLARMALERRRRGRAHVEAVERASAVACVPIAGRSGGIGSDWRRRSVRRGGERRAAGTTCRQDSCERRGASRREPPLLDFTPGLRHHRSMPSDDRSPLTERQKAILDFVAVSAADYGYPPTHREICERFGYSSYGTVHKHLRLLREKGYLDRDAPSEAGVHHGRAAGRRRTACGAAVPRADRRRPADRGAARRRHARRPAPPAEAAARASTTSCEVEGRVDDRRGNPRRRLRRRPAARDRPSRARWWWR
jgi:hypothetical protein